MPCARVNGAPFVSSRSPWTAYRSVPPCFGPVWGASVGSGVASAGASVASAGASVASAGASVASAGASVASAGASVASAGASVAAGGASSSSPQPIRAAVTPAPTAIPEPASICRRVIGLFQVDVMVILRVLVSVSVPPARVASLA